MRQLIIAVCCFFLLRSSADAQLGFLDKVFTKVTDVNVSYLIGRPLRGNQLVSDKNGKLDMHGLGFEVALNLGPLVPRAKLKCATVTKYKPTEIQKGDTTYASPEEVLDYPADVTTPEEKRRHARYCERNSFVDAEVSIGYSQLGGFTGRRGLQLQGSIENLPAIGIYAVSTLDTWWFTPYIGVRTGLAQLKGFQAFPTDTGRVTASGSTWQIGVAPGVSIGSPDFDGALFVEAEWMHRKFEDIQWTAVGSRVPPEIRSPTRLSTFVLSVGGQIGIGQED